MTAIQKHAACLLAAFLTIAFFLSRPAYAHYLWVVQESDRYVIARGTPPEDQETYNPEAVTLIRVFDQEGNKIPIKRVNENGRVYFQAQQSPAITAVMCDWGGRVKTTRGKKLMTRKEAEAEGFKVLEAFVSTQTSKTLFQDGAAVCKNLGMRFELVPLKSPLQLRPGTQLKIRLLFDGAPLQDVTVSTDRRVEAKTDEKGIARLDGSHEGWNIVMARHKVVASGDSGINYHQFMTFLLYRVP